MGRYSDAAIQEVTSRPWPPQSEVKVITAAEPPVIMAVEPWATPPNYFEQLDKSVRVAAEAVVSHALSKLKTSEEKTLKVSSAIIHRPARQAIVEEAEESGADLIVMGSRGLGAWNRLLLGSVSSAVVHHAKCSVEIVRRRETK